MMRVRIHAVGAGLILLTMALSGHSVTADATETPPVAAMPAADYARAERFLRWNADHYVLNSQPEPHWIGHSDRFWFRRDVEGGSEFVVVDAATGRETPAFDHPKLAAALAAASGKKLKPDKLPFSEFNLADDQRSLRFIWDGKTWQCGLAEYNCESRESTPSRSGELASPDGKWAVFGRNHNLWLKSLGDGSERALTTDGAEHYGYGELGEAFRFITFKRRGINVLVAMWSPDSRRLITQRVDERNVGQLHLIQSAPQSGSGRPIDYGFRFPLPGDPVLPTADLFIFDIQARSAVRVQHSPFPYSNMSALPDGQMWWAANSRSIFMLPDDLGPDRPARQDLLKIDATTGAVRRLIEDQAETFVDTPPPAVQTLTNDDIIWYSERSGWGHLYLYDAQGRLKNPITRGDWQVREIIRVDEAAKRIYFTAGGREGRVPYFRYLYSVDFSGASLHLLTPEYADHQISANNFIPINPNPPTASQLAFSPSGRYFVDTYSRADLPPATVIRTAEGRLIAAIEHADISRLKTDGLVLPELFAVMAADEKTTLYGVLYRPSNFSADKSYPVLDVIYPGPQRIGAYYGFMDALFNFSDMQCLAELGFIVMALDARGTPLRSKAFHDYAYGRMGEAGLVDHVAALKQLATRFPYIDLKRAGIYGHSAGGFAAARAILAYPDVFKVAVASSGTHNLQSYYPAWGYTYQGPYSKESYAEADNNLLARNLKGKLLLVHGDLDDNVSPALTLQLASALIRANRDFDMLILPNANHMLEGSEAYFSRRRWDYFVRNLLHIEPPADYRISGPSTGQSLH